MLKETVQKKLKKELKDFCFKSENDKVDIKRNKIHSFLQNHERWDIFVNNVCEQVLIAEKQLGRKFNGEGLKAVCKESIKLFAAAAVEHKEQQLMTDAEIIRRQTKNRKAKAAEELIKNGTFQIADPSTRNPKDKKVTEYVSSKVITSG